MKSRTVVSLLALGLTGCAVHPHVSSPAHPDYLAEASLWLDHSAQSAAHSLRHLDEITAVHLKNPAVAVTHVSTVSGMTDHLQVHWSGPVNRLMKVLAQRIGWRATFTIHPSPMPDVAIWNTGAPLPVIVRQINAQMRHVATLRILPLGRTLELTHYDAQWLPEHPVLCPQPTIQPGGPMLPAVASNSLSDKTILLTLHGGKITPTTHLLTIGKGGSLHPLKVGPHGPNIPLQTALTQHWKLLMPAHPTPAENAIASKWTAAGGILYRLN